MLDSYKEGQDLKPEDFSQPYYCPAAVYDHVEVRSIVGETVQLVFVGFDGEETPMDVSKSDMEKMLGWNVSSGAEPVDSGEE